ncbi:MAG: DUF368 domain-containing protein [Oscillibacter sp.]|nr:DUF368 domain-containing protein [Oscillibacter sp.]
MDRRSALRFFRNLLCGVLIGAGTILPGISGTVLAVVFGVYRPMMEIFTSPRRALPRFWPMIPPLAVGWAVGFLVFAKWVHVAYSLAPAATVWLFIGLIAGTFPALWREAGKEGRGAGAYAAFVLCALLAFAGLFYAHHIARMQVTPNFFWYSFCGMLWGMSTVVPGMTSSSVMMALGLYEPMLRKLAEMDLLTLSACLPAMVLTIALLARAVTALMRRYYAAFFHAVAGVVAATTLVIVPLHYEGTKEIALSVLACAIGFAIAYWMARLDSALPKE